MANPAPEYRKLPIPERLQLVEEIWDSIAQEAKSLPLSDELRAELDRRWAEHERDPSSAVPWEQVRSELYEPRR
jgi:putative addiction module component (TIGR02574 family)